MIWLASYPRSGNTFLRIVLSEVYGIESSEYPVGPNKINKPGYNYLDYEVIKTHSLPSKLQPKDKSIPAVLLVRDGRDSMVSYAHHWKNFTDPESEFYENLKSAILAKKKSRMIIGWGDYVNAWLKRSALVIKFEELITNPIVTVEKLRQIMDLPEPNVEKLPGFKDLRSKRMNYGNVAQKRSQKEQAAHREKFFRKGKVGAWREEMPDELHELFWLHHGEVMDKMGYQDGKISNPAPKNMLSKISHTQKLK